MGSRSSGSVILLLVVAALGVACSKRAGPQPKTKDEAFQVFEKHKATYIRCEKLMARERAAAPPPASAEPLDAGPGTAADAAADAGKRTGPDAGSRAGAPAVPAASASAGLPPGASSGTPSPQPAAAKSAAPPPAGAAQECETEYWREMKRDMGQYDQATMDQWYLEWRKGVKVE